MDSEDESLCVLPAVIIQRKKTTKKKRKHRVWVHQIYREREKYGYREREKYGYREREKYGVSYLANQMGIYNREQYFK